ncbi:MAG: hypothetical protein IJQ34_07410, partial [Kiritimatiellae bacterium]|nr:hypothetical protein [Kiritimatiellia bacterium]
MKFIDRKSWLLIAALATVVFAAYAASNPKTREPKCDSEEIEECTDHTPPSADGVIAEANCDNFTFSISNLVDAVEKWHTVIHWTGDGDCMEDSEKSNDETTVAPDVTWTATLGGETITGSGATATIEPGTNATASCTFVMEATMPKCSKKLSASVAGSATFFNEVTLSGGGNICTTSSSHPSHRAVCTVGCGDVEYVSDAGLDASGGVGEIWVSGSTPVEGGTLIAKARGGEASVTYNVYDVGELVLTGGCGCFPDCSETMNGHEVSATQYLLPSGNGSIKKNGTTFTGWFDCNGNNEPDGDEPQTSKNYTVVSLGSLRIAANNDAGGANNESFAPGTELIITIDGANPANGVSLSVGDLEPKEKGCSPKTIAASPNGAGPWSITIPADCPAGTFTIEAIMAGHTCKKLTETITVAGCSCSTCDRNGDMDNENDCIDIFFGLGRTETGGAKSRVHVRLDEPSQMPEMTSRTFPDGRMETYVTNGVRYVEFYETTNATPHVAYELTPGDTAFTILENRNGTPRRFTRWTKHDGDNWDMEVFDASVSPMELVERVAKTETTTDSGRLEHETNGIVESEREYRRLSDGDMFLVRETLGTGANARTTYHAPVESDNGF